MKGDGISIYSKSMWVSQLSTYVSSPGATYYYLVFNIWTHKSKQEKGGSEEAGTIQRIDLISSLRNIFAKYVKLFELLVD